MDMAIVEIHLSVEEFTPLRHLFQYFPSDVLSILYRKKQVWVNSSMIFLTNIYNEGHQALYGISQYVLLWNSYFNSTFSSELFAMTYNVKERKGIM
jgi:hypothetical protein